MHKCLSVLCYVVCGSKQKGERANSFTSPRIRRTILDKTGVGANSFTNPRMRLFSFFFFHSFYLFLFFPFFSFDCVDICAIIHVLLSLCGERKYKNKNHKKNE